MDIQTFKKAISKSHTKNIIVGSCITLFGVFIVWLILSGADSEMDDMGVGGLIVIWILAGICLLFGGGITFMHVKDALRMKKGDHPVINAIEQGDKGFLVWVYEYVTQVQGGGSDHQIWAYDREGNKMVLSLKKKRVQEVMTYLSDQFPAMVVGYSEEIRAQMSEAVGKKL